MKTDVTKVEINGVKYVREDVAGQASPLADDYYIVRTYSAGVFAGEIVSREGKECEMRNARRLWYWKGAASLSQLAMEGVKCPGECKFPCEVNRVILTEVIEIIPCSTAAQKNIKAVPIWKK